MKWLQQIIKKVCNKIGLIEKDGSIRFQNYSITIIDDNDLYSIRVVDLISFQSPQIYGPFYYDEIESTLNSTIQSL